ncbi:MAG: glycosyltransferase family 4 protein, partial [Candidatus Entotheonellia bacterium]
AYACEPGKGSEPGVGWNWVRQIARFHEAWVITRANNRKRIEHALRKEPIANVHWVYFDLPRWARFWKKGRRGVHPYYYLWQVGAYWTGRRLHQEASFDLAHHLTFGIDWIPSFLAFLPVPFVWGPIVGAQSVDESFRRTLPWKAQMQERIRTWVRQLSRVDPLVCGAARRVALSLASTPEAAEHLSRLGCKEVVLHPSVGMSSRDIETLSCTRLLKESRSGVRFVSVGDLLAFKGLDLALKAFAEVQGRFPQAEWWIIGDGPERDRLMHLTDQLGIRNKVRFWGWMPRQEVLTRLSECDVLLFPCLRGAISMACLEAMAVGLPVICLDLGGPALQVTEETGFKLPAIAPAQVVNDLRKAMLLLARNPDCRKRMGEAARRRVIGYFDWDSKGKWISEVYQQIVSRSRTQ